MSTLPAGVRPYLSFWTMLVDKYGDPSEPLEVKAFNADGAEELARIMFNSRTPGGLSFKVFASKYECERAIETVNLAQDAMKLQKQFGADARQVQRAVEHKIAKNERDHRAARARNERLAEHAAHSQQSKGPRN